MPFNGKLLKKQDGVMRLLAVIGGIIALVLFLIAEAAAVTIVSSVNSVNTGSIYHGIGAPVGRHPERAVVFQWSVIICLAFETTLLCLALFGKLEKKCMQFLDKAFHVLAAQLLIVISIIILADTFHAFKVAEFSFARLMYMLASLFELACGVVCGLFVYYLSKGVSSDDVPPLRTSNPSRASRR